MDAEVHTPTSSDPRALDAQPSKRFIDATVDGGHAEALLSRTAPTATRLDRDAELLEHTRRRLCSDDSRRLLLAHSDFQTSPRSPNATTLATASCSISAAARTISIAAAAAFGAAEPRHALIRLAPSAAAILASRREEELARIFFELGEAFSRQPSCASANASQSVQPPSSDLVVGALPAPPGGTRQLGARFPGVAHRRQR
jgi:hypothetical protein